MVRSPFGITFRQLARFRLSLSPFTLRRRMVTSNGMALRPPLLVVLLGLLSSTVDAFYLPGSAPIDYKRGEQVPLWLDSIKTGSADSRGNLKWVSA